MARRTVEEWINWALSDGYKLTETGYGDYTEPYHRYRAKGLMVYMWYVPSDKEGQKKYEVYTREKKRSPKKVQRAKHEMFTIDYEGLTVKELKNFCKEKKIAKYYKLNKLQMIEELKKVG